MQLNTSLILHENQSPQKIINLVITDLIAYLDTIVHISEIVFIPVNADDHDNSVVQYNYFKTNIQNESTKYFINMCYVSKDDIKDTKGIYDGLFVEISDDDEAINKKIIDIIMEYLGDKSIIRSYRILSDFGTIMDEKSLLTFVTKYNTYSFLVDITKKSAKNVD